MNIPSYSYVRATIYDYSYPVNPFSPSFSLSPSPSMHPFSIQSYPPFPSSTPSSCCFWEYGGRSVWDPYHKTEIEALEAVQRFALRMCLKSWSADYDQLLLETGLPSFKTRLSALSLSQLHKIIKKLTILMHQ